MEQRRYIAFVLLSTVILFGWLTLGPKLLPDMFPKPAKQQAKEPPAAVAENKDDATAEAPATDAAAPEAETPAAAAAPDAADVDAAKPDDLPALQKFDNPGEIVLGSMKPDSGFFLELKIDPQGAGIVSATLNDPRFTTADGKNQQLAVIGNNPLGEQTLDTDVGVIDAQLKAYNESLRTVVWKVVSHDESSAVFSYPAPDGTLEIIKTYKLNQGNAANRDGDFLGYVVDVEIELKNLGQQPRAVNYVLQGPVGLPLENVEDTRTFIEIKVGTTAKPGSPVQYLARTYAKQREQADANNDPTLIDAWRDPIAFVGVDVQYFTALVIPQVAQPAAGNQPADATFAVIKPDLVGALQKVHPDRTDLSLRMESREISLAAGGEQTDAFRLYLGPKRPELLQPLNAGGTITFGWFSFVSVGMVYALNFFHQVLKLPYGFAIVLLTLIVRACMFPITRKQAAGAKKMKDLQPKLQELKTKYAKEPEKFWQAQRELFRKHNYSPLSGCLPLVLQLPIFIGLYNALSFDVDLRMAPFLWFDNLAAPDALFGFGMELPFVHWTHFNLLPLITICLWVVQQKMFMPPPATEEQALQYKVMNYMMIFIGFMIYRVPAGLCVYFITSTLWGISERKLIDYMKIDEKKTEEPTAIETTATPAPSVPEAPRAPGWLSRLVAAADDAKLQGTGRPNETAGTSGTKDRRNGKKKRPKR
jgi:YidC/Oxa1 family membrane protein insertase